MRYLRKNKPLTGKRREQRERERAERESRERERERRPWLHVSSLRGLFT